MSTTTTLTSSTPFVPAIEKYNRQVRTLSTFEAAVVLGVGLPVFAATVLPLSITYQLAKAGYGSIFGNTNKQKAAWSYQDSGFTVKPKDRKPLSERAYDVVVLGATGFTGGLAVRHLVKAYYGGGGLQKKKVKFAIAGRSQKKLDAFKEKLAQELNNPTVLQIPTILVDTTRPDTIPALVQDTRVVATTAGPYSHYGSPVVEFCAKFGTHYVDITGEDNWVKQMKVRYQSVARETGSKIIPFCGHDSIPWDILVMKMQDTLEKECNDQLQSVTFWDQLVGDFAGGTLATVIAGVEGNLPEAPKEKVFRQNANGQLSDYRVKKDLPSIPQTCTSPWDAATKTKRWTVPFFMAEVNAAVVSWSQALRETGCKTITYAESWVHPDWKTAASMYAIVFMMGTSLLNPLTLGLAKKYLTQPGSGPTMKDMEEKHYIQVAGEGIGENGNRVQVMFYLPKDPGCMETSRMLIESALTLTETSPSSLPKRGGGFWTPSTALGDALVQRIMADEGSTLEIRVLPAGSLDLGSKNDQ